MENVIIAIFDDEKSTYQVLSDLKNRSGQSTVLQAGIIQNVGGSIVVRDGWLSASGFGSSWATGGFIGGLIGILGGPLGMLWGASIGMLVGSTVDVGEMSDWSTVLEEAAYHLQEGILALVVVADEESPGELDSFLTHYGVKTIIRQDVATVAQEIEQAKEAAKELKKQAHAQMRAEKKHEWRQKGKEMHDKIKESFEDLKK